MFNAVETTKTYNIKDPPLNPKFHFTLTLSRLINGTFMTEQLKKVGLSGDQTTVQLTSPNITHVKCYPTPLAKTWPG